MASAGGYNLFNGIIRAIKSYEGDDPLLPWMQGIKKIKRCLPRDVVKEKLPRFLQRCISSFQGDGRYRDDLRYLRVWILLMDYVDNPRKLLREMEDNHIGAKCSLFYQAYALYFEKQKKFEESEKMYALGFKNLAEPGGELLKSHEQFLRRWNQYKLRKTKIFNDLDTSHARMKVHRDGLENHKPTSSRETGGTDISGKDSDATRKRLVCRGIPSSIESKSEVGSRKAEFVKPSTFTGEDTVVVKFVGSTIVGKSEEAEDACHHGLVDPTINMKEAMNAINNMFQEPLDVDVARFKRSNRQGISRPSRNGFEVFVDEEANKGRITDINQMKDTARAHKGSDDTGPLEIFVDDEEERDQIQENLVGHEMRQQPDVKNSSEDKVVSMFVDSMISDDSSIENAFHHGLLDPTISMKEALDDINGMFGKPIDFVNTSKLKNSKMPTKKVEPGGLSIYVDADAEKQQIETALCSSNSQCLEEELNQPTMFTKEAMEDINEMFGRPLDF